jgi:hypothetical protein
MEQAHVVGITVQTIHGNRFNIYGDVSYSAADETYYCDGQSWPQEIVDEVICDRQPDYEDEDRHSMYA